MGASLEQALVLRPAGPQDGGRIQALVRGLSPRTRYLRFFSGVRELPSTWLERFTRADPEGEFTLLASTHEAGEPRLAGMAQYATDPWPQRGDFALLVDDAWQGHGIGRQLLRGLECVARDAGIERIEGDVLAENEPMLRLARSLGYTVRRDPASALTLRVAKPLADTAWRCPPLSRPLEAPAERRLAA